MGESRYKKRCVRNYGLKKGVYRQRGYAVEPVFGNMK